MTLPDKALFTTKEACQVLALSQSSVRRLIEEGQLSKVYPRPRSMRITRESLAAHLEKAATPGAVRSSIEATTAAQAQARAMVEQEQAQKKRGGLLSRWGLGG